MPAKAACSGLKPTAWVGKKRAGVSWAICGMACAMMPSTKAVSTRNGKWGPCCSVAATGNTATRLAILPSAWHAAKFWVVQSAQYREGLLIDVS